MKLLLREAGYMQVLITANSFGKHDGQVWKILTENGFEIKNNPYGRIMNEQEMLQLITGIDAIILGTEILNAKIIQHANNLKIVSRYGVGIDNVDAAALKARGILLTVTQGSNNQAVADFTIGLMLDVARGISYVDRKLRLSEWEKKIGIDLCGKLVGVIGLGAIGREVVKRLKGFECDIYGYDIHYDDVFCEKYKVKKASLKEIFMNSDFITLHIPAISFSKPLIGKEEIGMMKKNVVIINTARSSLVDDEALISALQEKRIFGAGIDAQLSARELDERYLNLDNVVVTPHNAAVSIEASNKMSYTAVKNIIDFFNKRRDISG